MRIVAFLGLCLCPIAAVCAADGAPPPPPPYAVQDVPAADRPCPPPTTSAEIRLPDGTKVRASTADCIEPRPSKD